MPTTDMPSCILNLKICILTSKSEKSIILNDYLSYVGVKFEQVATRKINFMKRTNLHKFSCNFLEKLSEKVATRTVYLTMSTKNKITKGLMIRCTKAAKTKQYVQVSS